MTNLRPFLATLFVGVLASSAAWAQATLCTDTCTTANDGDCDDGGPGSDFSICALGSDCTDCGPRSATGAEATLCSNTCSSSSDNECDDGGPGSLYSICALGTDCADCGPRSPQATRGGGTTSRPAPVAAPYQQGNNGGGDRCTNTCQTANDGECDDGGPGSLYSICALGTDCNDCGSRSAQIIARQGQQAAETCSNTCGSANDGECDDGGPGSLYSICALGTDCNDCGPRTPVAGAGLCTNACATSNDGECDDGGPGSLYSICDYGTDCNDCGTRQALAQNAGGVCSNTCRTSNDGECDDGGPGSLYSICALGSDCNDCGPRTSSQRAMPQGAPGTSLCSNYCGTANNGVCEDGAPGAYGDTCALGSDCGDCGPRPGCTNTCRTANDGECDDGGPNSLYSICDLGTDCNDCGERR